MNQELINLIEDFLNQKGLWYKFEEFVENRGFSMDELGFEEDI